MPSAPTHRPTVAVVGAGFAGAAAALALARSGARRVVLVEAEGGPGRHASGRSAGMIRQAVDSPALAALAAAGARALAGPLGTGIFRPGAAALLGDAGPLLELAKTLEASGGPPSRLLGSAEARSRFPVLRGAAVRAALETPGDGVVDAPRLLERMLGAAREAGAELRYGERLLEIEVSGDRVGALVTGSGRLTVDAVVNAAGAWADEVARRAGLEPLGLAPRRRHVHVAKLSGPGRAPGGFLWDVTDGWYLRAEGDSVLLCACDEVADRPGEPAVDPREEGRLRALLGTALPDLGDFRVERRWAGLRTFAPDGGFVFGPDPRLAGFHWAAALGGHGVTCALALGDAVEASFDRPERLAPELRPERFLTEPRSQSSGVHSK